MKSSFKTIKKIEEEEDVSYSMSYDSKSKKSVLKSKKEEKILKINYRMQEIQNLE